MVKRWSDYLETRLPYVPVFKSRKTAFGSRAGGSVGRRKRGQRRRPGSHVGDGGAVDVAGGGNTSGVASNVALTAQLAQMGVAPGQQIHVLHGVHRSDRSFASAMHR